MQCDKVIRELAVPTDDRDPASLAEHLAQCPSCATWADRATRFERLWEATRPAEPTGEMWDTVWTQVSRAVDESTPVEQKAFTLRTSSRNGSAAKTEKSPVLTGRSSRLRTRRLMAIGSLGIAQAAAIVLAVWLSWQPAAKSPDPQVADTKVVPSFVTTDSNGTVSTDGVVEIEEGQQIVIRIEGPAVRVVDLTPKGISYGVNDWNLALNDLTPEGMSYGANDWYLAFNEVEGIANLVVAMEGVTPWRN
jgi:hypothetical protein